MKDVFESFMSRYIKFLSIEKSYLTYKKIYKGRRQGLSLDYNIEAVVFNAYNCTGKTFTIGYE